MDHAGTTQSVTLRHLKTLMVAALALLAVASHAQEGISKSAVILGQSAALTGPSAALGLPFTQGAKLYFDRLNNAGGINGRKVEVVSIDDAGSPEHRQRQIPKNSWRRVFFHCLAMSVRRR